MTGQQEGVVKYDLDFTAAPAPPQDTLTTLIRWRRTLFDHGLIGQQPDRYDGLGYGNVSQRHPHGFLISGTQTSGIRELAADGFSLVTDWDLGHNRLTATGPSPPSSEALSHAAVYDAGQHINFVLHVHSTELWHAARRSSVACTPEFVDYGTPAMARAVARIVAQAADPDLLVMGGHQDGLIAFGSQLPETARLLLTLEESA
ncbi:MAG: class II aldolase/adducin family protein [Xanthomonadales bacterium]|nr:class II aldolase/adducin family protein [Xanthomonadales bacterium]